MAAENIDRTFGGEWPFTPRHFDTPTGRLHYVEEGPPDGPPAVLLHGNPTWGFLFRSAVRPLADAGRRVIVPDLLGFGRSAKPRHAGLYTVGRHIERLGQLLEDLAVERPYLIAHDWGGPILLGWAAQRGLAAERILLMNTFPPQMPGPMGSRRRNRILRAPLLGEVLFQGLDIMTRGFLFGEGSRHAAAMPSQVRRAYQEPHPSWASRAGTLALPRQIPTRASHPVAHLSREIAGWLQAAPMTPVHFVWGARDPLFGPATLEAWRALLPTATVTVLDDAAHYVLEDASSDAVAEIVSFLDADLDRSRK